MLLIILTNNTVQRKCILTFLYSMITASDPWSDSK